nr:sulfurtransferase TusA family protein [Candidatus Sigynarchaeota archaeon]
MVSTTLDTLGKKCPMPVLMAKKELARLAPGDTLVVLADDAGALKDMPALVKKLGDELVSTDQDGSRITFAIRKH